MSFAIMENIYFAVTRKKIHGEPEVGKSADLVILSDDIYSIDPDRIENVKVLETIFEGETIYKRQCLPL